MPEMDRASGTWEDMGMKAKWFHDIHGEISNGDLNRKLNEALDHIQVLRASRTKVLDPGGEIDKDFELISSSQNDELTEVSNPYPSSSKGFVTKCLEIKVVTQGMPIYVKFKPLNDMASIMDLRTTTVCLFNKRTRQWNLVEHSGYNEKHGYIWGQVHRSGIYSAIALPKDSAKTEVIALEAFAYYYTRFGVESGLAANVDEYFDKETFLRLARVDQNLSVNSKADKALLSDLSKAFDDTVKLRPNWKGQLPNGGMLDWHLIEYLADRKFTLLKPLGLSYFVTRFPWIFRNTYRVGRWYPLGPANVSGRIKCLAIHPANGSILYAGSANGGVWKTTNGGNTWRYLWKFEDSMAVGSLAIAPTAYDTLYAATGEDTTHGPSYGGVGVYKTTDAGRTWTQKSDARTLGARCSKIIVHPRDSNIVYLASVTGIHKTSDGGDHWSLILAGHATDLIISSDSPKILYAGIYNDGVYKSIDDGVTWNRISSMVTIKTPHAALAFPFPTGANAGWIKLAIGINGTFGSKFIIAKMGVRGGDTYASVDEGASWTIMLGSEPWDYVTWGSFVAIHPADSRRIYLGGFNIQYSNDGIHFTRSTISHTDHHQIVFDPGDNAICFVCGDGGVFRSADYGATWQLKSSNLTATQLMSLGVSERGDFVAGSATQDQGIIQTSGSPIWNDFGGGNEWGMFVVDPNDSKNIYISPGGGSMIRCSRDGGHSYTNPTAGLTHYWESQRRQTRPAAFSHVAAKPGVSNFLIGAAVVSDEVKAADGRVIDSYGPISHIYYSRNWGHDWFNAFTPTSRPFRVAYSPSDSNRAYAASLSGDFYRSDNGGETEWYEPASSKNRPPTGRITCIAVDPTDPDAVYITYGNVNPHVYRSVDGGQHWTSISGMRADMSLPDIAAISLVVDPENEDILFVATDIGVFRSNDCGSSWYFYNDSDGESDLPKIQVTGLAMNSSTRRLFASTMGRGLYYTYMSGFLNLRVIAISHYFFPRRYMRGIARLRVTNGSETYIMSRSDVINRIKAGTNFYTIGSDNIRAEVMLMPPDIDHPIEYLMTTPDSTRYNNLLSLPEF